MLIALVLSFCSVPAPGEPPAPRSKIELEAKPPDEPTSSEAPNVEAVPETAPSTGVTPPASGDNNTPVEADSVAHPPEIVTYVVPQYPLKAREAGLQGRVLVMVIIDEKGKVENGVQIVDSIPMLDQAAIDAVRQWRFSPARDSDGNPVRVQKQVGVPFTLQ